MQRSAEDGTFPFLCLLATKLLFLLYVNDLPAVVAECTVSLYADDVTIYYANKDEERVSEALNANLQRVATWIEANRLRMNITKTQLMTLGGRL